MTISFEGRVGHRHRRWRRPRPAYALETCPRGAKVVVNDLAEPRRLGSSDAAAKVVRRDRTRRRDRAWPTGPASPTRAVEALRHAKERWGGVHILINNAGILRDKSFAKMTMDDFRLVVEVHLIGSANCTKAVWETMREQAYGRILMTSSSTGLFGNFGQANYGAAKLGLAGFAKTLHLEGAKYNIRVNSLAPTAATRMTEDIFPPEMMAAFNPDNVVPAALFLVSEEAPSNMIVGAGGGVVQASYVTLTPGFALPEGRRTVEEVAANWHRIADRTGEIVPQSGAEQAMLILETLRRQ
jgi:NAD(P)-dependent dehydrogenase (short-subunit alcohol dehydrogenase family)